ncbi:MAG: electron transport complex subunit RsxG [Gammaproteobacteria bacterium]|nr:electron transport complex subunit RsxG [Gammaproteobacteria bacterium]
MSLGRAISRNALILGAFALLSTGLVLLVHQLSAGRIAAQERAALEGTLQQLVPETAYDNKLYADCTSALDPELLGSRTPVRVYRARRAGQPVALILSPVAPDGYSGAIHLLVGVYRNGRLAGVRVATHKETPGLGDKIETRKSDWILSFAGKSLSDPGEEGWKVDKDGGQFDAFAGATITPRAVVKAVYQSLEYVQLRADALYAAPNECRE